MVNRSGQNKLKYYYSLINLCVTVEYRNQCYKYLTCQFTKFSTFLLILFDFNFLINNKILNKFNKI